MFNEKYNKQYREKTTLPNGNLATLFGHWNDLGAYYFDGESYWLFRSGRFINQGEKLARHRGWNLAGKSLTDIFNQS